MQAMKSVHAKGEVVALNAFAYAIKIQIVQLTLLTSLNNLKNQQQKNALVAARRIVNLLAHVVITNVMVHANKANKIYTKSKLLKIK